MLGDGGGGDGRQFRAAVGEGRVGLHDRLQEIKARRFRFAAYMKSPESVAFAVQNGFGDPQQSFGDGFGAGGADDLVLRGLNVVLRVDLAQGSGQDIIAVGAENQRRAQNDMPVKPVARGLLAHHFGLPIDIDGIHRVIGQIGHGAFRAVENMGGRKLDQRGARRVALPRDVGDGVEIDFSGQIGIDFAGIEIVHLGGVDGEIGGKIVKGFADVAGTREIAFGGG